jgi:signal peptidase II
VSASTSRKYLLFGVFFALSLALDQWTKALAREHLRPRGPFNAKVVIDGFFNLRYSENPGVAFGMLQQIPGGKVILTGLAIVAIVLVLMYLRRTDADASRLHVALGLVGGGALGNVIDRITYGRVTDFIVWHIKTHEWPTFNVADAALCIGVGLMMLDMVLSRPTSSPPDASPSPMSTSPRSSG